MDRYYAGENTGSLVREFHLIASPGNLARLFPPLVLENIRCLHCNEAMIQMRPSRTAVQRGEEASAPYCPACGHVNDSNCPCLRCEAIRKEIERKAESEFRGMLMAARREERREPVGLADLSLAEAIDLITLMRVGGEEDSDHIEQIDRHGLALCCQPRLTQSVVYSLYERGYIDIAPDSPSNSLIVEEGGDLTLVLPYARWQLRLGNNEEENLQIIESLEACVGDMSSWPDHWTKGAIEVWRDLALDELLAYLEQCLHDHHLESRFGAKTKRVLLDLLDQFSIYKIYNFIWGSVKDAVSYQVRTGCYKRQAANSIVGRCQGRAERAFAEEWEIKDYRRNPRIERSCRVEYFANVVTTLGERFYSERPTSGLVSGK